MIMSAIPLDRGRCNTVRYKAGTWRTGQATGASDGKLEVSSGAEEAGVSPRDSVGVGQTDQLTGGGLDMKTE